MGTNNLVSEPQVWISTLHHSSALTAYICYCLYSFIKMLITQCFSACLCIDINTYTYSNPCMFQSVLMVNACSLNACVFVCMSSCVQSTLSRSLATLTGSQSSLACSAVDRWQIGAHGPSVSTASLRPHPKGHSLHLLCNLCSQQI